MILAIEISKNEHKSNIYVVTLFSFVLGDTTSLQSKCLRPCKKLSIEAEVWRANKLRDETKQLFIVLNWLLFFKGIGMAMASN